MAKPSQERATAPLYVRWNPERSSYAVELRLELVSRLNSLLVQADRLGIEIGGMLLGSLPDPEIPTLRIDDVAIISRRFEDGAIYMLDPGQQHRLDEIGAAARAQNRDCVGFFRSHMRPGALQPALADRTLLTEQFPQGVYALLLVQSREPRTAAFFLASNGQLPDQPSARKFYFDEFYGWLIYWTQELLARVAAFIDRWIIDAGAVGGSSRGVWGIGAVLRLMQVGNLQAYAFLFGLGVVALIWFTVFRS